MGTGVPDWCDALSDVVFVFDGHQRLSYANAAAARLVGRPAGEFLGRTMTELADGQVGFFGDNPLRSAIVHRVLPHILAGGTLTDDETTVLLADGSTGTFSWRLNPIRADGAVTGAVLVMRDMTELSNATFQAAPVGMFRVRGDGEVLEVNTAFRTLLGHTGQS